MMVNRLRNVGYDVYDFRNPHGTAGGFHWSEIDEHWQSWTPSQFRDGLEDVVAVNGFQMDMEAMRWADACVLVLPCGRSAHLEAGWFCGAGKPVICLLADGEPELMYSMMTDLCVGFQEVLLALELIEDTVEATH